MGTRRHRSSRPDGWLPFVQTTSTGVWVTVGTESTWPLGSRSQLLGPRGRAHKAAPGAGRAVQPRVGNAPAQAGLLRRPASSRGRLRGAAGGSAAGPRPPGASAAGLPSDARSLLRVCVPRTPWCWPAGEGPAPRHATPGRSPRSRSDAVGTSTCPSGPAPAPGLGAKGRTRRKARAVESGRV